MCGKLLSGLPEIEMSCWKCLSEDWMCEKSLSVKSMYRSFHEIEILWKAVVIIGFQSGACFLLCL